MDLQNLLPHQSQPIQRTTAGQLPAELAELSDETLCNSGVLPSFDGFPVCWCLCLCADDGDEAE